jgi:glutamate--cysteine ligase
MIEKNKLFSVIKENKLWYQLFQGNFGIEKENLRVDKQGKLALTSHPKAFGNKLTNPYINCDFGESQIEMITPVCNSLEKAYHFLENLHDIVTLELDNEYLWPQSLPCILPDEHEIQISQYDESERGREESEYRQYLSQKYGRKHQCISGIHFNFSFSDIFLQQLYKHYITDLTYKEFKNRVYLKITRNFIKHGWFLPYLLGASSPAHESFINKNIENIAKLSEDAYFLEHAVSFRTGLYGYRNLENLLVSYDSVEEYLNCIDNLVKNGKLKNIGEYYGQIRLKAKDKENPELSLINEGIHYIELRPIDLNPFIKTGVDLMDLKFLHLFLLYCFFENGDTISQETLHVYKQNHDLAATVGKNKGITFRNEDSSFITAKAKFRMVADKLTQLFEELNLTDKELIDVIEYQTDKFIHEEKMYVNRLLAEVKSKGYINFHLEKAKLYYAETYNYSYSLKGYEDMELSTQIIIKDAITRGLRFEIIDRSENFIAFSFHAKTEYIKQANKTSLDSYISYLIMENKLVTKNILHNHGIKVPIGNHFENAAEAKANFEKYCSAPLVIKPKTTNYGIGISIFKAQPSQIDFEKAVDIAFKEDTSILIEEFINGTEYRFFVIGDNVVAVLNRIPAHIIGNGTDTIRNLVALENKNSFRGEGHRTPLEKIKLEITEEMFLKNQGKNFEYIPAAEEIVYLRENSNISTGGIGIDFTDLIAQSYKNIAVKAAKAVNAIFCGVDMIINDIYNNNPDNNYAIIELNFNPNMYIHCFPYKGKNRKLGQKVLDKLGF